MLTTRNRGKWHAIVMRSPGLRVEMMVNPQGQVDTLIPTLTCYPQRCGTIVLVRALRKTMAGHAIECAFVDTEGIAILPIIAQIDADQLMGKTLLVQIVAPKRQEKHCVVSTKIIIHGRFIQCTIKGLVLRREHIVIEKSHGGDSLNGDDGLNSVLLAAIQNLAPANSVRAIEDTHHAISKKSPTLFITPTTLAVRYTCTKKDTTAFHEAVTRELCDIWKSWTDFVSNGINNASSSLNSSPTGSPSSLSSGSPWLSADDVCPPIVRTCPPNTPIYYWQPKGYPEWSCVAHNIDDVRHMDADAITAIIDEAFDMLLQPSWLFRVSGASQGNIHIYQTPMAWLIDVNSHKVTHTDRVSASAINRAAIATVIRAVHLHQMYGMILIDFIGGRVGGKIAALCPVLRQEFRKSMTYHKDQAVDVLGCTNAGLVEMTRSFRRLGSREVMHDPNFAFLQSLQHHVISHDENNSNIVSDSTVNMVVTPQQYRLFQRDQHLQQAFNETSQLIGKKITLSTH